MLRKDQTDNILTMRIRRLALAFALLIALSLVPVGDIVLINAAFPPSISYLSAGFDRGFVNDNRGGDQDPCFYFLPEPGFARTAAWVLLGIADLAIAYYWLGMAPVTQPQRDTTARKTR
jgi:hypothetical protein